MRNGECCSRASRHSRDSADNVIASDIGLLVLSNVIYAQTVIGLIQPDDDKNSIVLLAGPGKDGRTPWSAPVAGMNRAVHLGTGVSCLPLNRGKQVLSSSWDERDMA